MAVCGVKVGKIKLFWKDWTKSDHKQIVVFIRLLGQF